jgi:hypothetical protein
LEENKSKARGCEDEIPHISIVPGLEPLNWQSFRASNLNATPSATNGRTLGNFRAVLFESF